MTFEESVKHCLTKGYLKFSGRASRSEYWWFFLATSLLDLALGMLPESLSFLAQVAGLALFLPTLGVAARRLHDLNHSALWLLLGYAVPCVIATYAIFSVLTGNGAGLILSMAMGVIALIIFLVFLVMFMMRGTEGPNRFGEDPLAAPAA
ncbi:MAG: DUF805 domain-containing protein [Succinivibrionaceae bacterium]|nr:DUF805 domain-containing protein [Succinivibrionaceae bacterium]